MTLPFSRSMARLAFQTAVEARQQLDSQLRENQQVAKEFGKLTANNQVYKLIGPVLVKQDQVEAKSNVDKRIEFIKSEMYVPFSSPSPSPPSFIPVQVRFN